MAKTSRKHPTGLTLIELLLTLTIASLPLFVMGVLLVSGQNHWSYTCNLSHKTIRQHAQIAAIAFTAVGKKSNQVAFRMYRHVGPQFLPPLPETSSTIAVGEAIEFRYWADQNPDTQSMDIANTGTHYAFFYFDQNQLKVDYGLVDQSGIGAIDSNQKTAPDYSVTLADHVVLDQSFFSRLNFNNCIRLRLQLQDPGDGQTHTVQSAIFMRNCWPG